MGPWPPPGQSKPRDPQPPAWPLPRVLGRPMKRHPPQAVGSAARPSGCRPPRSPWQPWSQLAWPRTGVSWRGSLAGAARAAPSPPTDDLPDRGDTETTVFDVPPAVDFAKHRAKLRVRDLQPVAQRLDRTAAPVGVTGDG